MAWGCVVDYCREYFRVHVGGWTNSVCARVRHMSDDHIASAIDLCVNICRAHVCVHGGHIKAQGS